ncbi:hypothetical protein P3535_22865 [Vibrio parahaemolyticus]|uniref:hypothetical protein n=1 Tax=Vibrio parahaemolyticus TaxID=670 RepID=UPI001869E6A0|nr:hypothetical protein [Vibrio parahaemolyticus]MBE4436128.1 hypothetical protein [Vibrio parahaemolyticus]MDF4815568.1 hypothetical protein [Vibrio parahaemolyticus]MDF4830380.1 hypothetical protein [Vibrio parahaemolyticus]MDF4835131.1 hypothetical protein [Vibrio parahaemolyticus]MEA5339497.1 hypothetical protein [Vibrio parahaemolyticus]
MDKKLAEYITNIKLKYLTGENKSLVGFPSKKQLGIDNKESLRVLVEQAEKLLTNRVDYCVFNKGMGIKDREKLLELFIADVEQFATEYELKISDKFMLRLFQSRISDHAFFHLASSSILPKTYESIDLLQHEGTFNVYSIPFKLRVAIENKIKSMIGFQSCDITRHGEVKKGTEEFPVTMIIQELIKLKCLNLPCSLQCVLNIYSWSCSFCHTGKKEYLWMSMKALETLSLLFLFEEQKKKEISIADLWHRCVLTEEYLVKKLVNYKGFSSPLYYLKHGWSIDMLQERLNNSKNKNLKPYKFYLSELALDEWKGFYCSSSGRWV